MSTYEGTGFLVHSAKGSTWPNHKYIRKDGNRYIYPDDADKIRYRSKKEKKRLGLSDILENYKYRHKTGDVNTGVYVNSKTGKAMEYRKNEDGVSFFSKGEKARTTKQNLLQKASLKAKVGLRKLYAKAFEKVKGEKLSTYEARKRNYKIERGEHDTVTEWGRWRVGKNTKNRVNPTSNSAGWSKWRIGKNTKNRVNPR